MMATIWPGPDRLRGRCGDMGIHVARGDRDPSRKTGPRRGLVAQGADPGTEGGEVVAELVAHEGPESGCQLLEVVRRGVLTVLEDALVAGRAGVARVGPGELPHDPVGCLHPGVHGVVDLSVVLVQLEGLGELPLRGDGPAVPRQPRLAPSFGQLVDPVGLRLCRVVLPQLHVRVRTVGVAVDLVQGRTVVEHRDHRAGREVGRQPDHVGRVDPGRGDGSRNDGGQDVAVVRGHLQRPVGRQATARREPTSMTPCRYSPTAPASSSPSDTRTTTARPDRVPKSTPTTYCSVALVGTNGPP